MTRVHRGGSGACAREREKERDTPGSPPLKPTGILRGGISGGWNLDMAGVKTVNLLVGVVLVFQCVGNVRAEIPASDGKNLHLKQPAAHNMIRES